MFQEQHANIAYVLVFNKQLCKKLDSRSRKRIKEWKEEASNSLDNAIPSQHAPRATVK